MPNPKPITPKKQTPVTPAPDPATAATPRYKPTPLQLDLLETCSDLILNSGKPEDLGPFLHILGRHRWHRISSEYDFSQRIARDVLDWKRQLGRVVPEKKIGVSGPARPELPVSVADIVRGNLRHEVADDLDRFVCDANALELHFMREVLELRNGSHTGGIPEEVPIAQYCSVQLDRCEKLYFAIPEDLENAFNQFRSMVEAEMDKRKEAA